MSVMRTIGLSITLAAVGIAPIEARAVRIELLNVSYDPTRELYRDINTAFSRKWIEQTKQQVTIRQSHGGSSKQARSVIDGLPADVVTLGMHTDIDAIAGKGLIKGDWRKRLPHDSSPYYSTIVLLVRKGNPKAIKDWGDLIKPDVKVITPNPKTSGGARWNYLAAWGYAQKKYGSPGQAKLFMAKLFRNVPVLDSGARGATTTFVERGQGDVLITWESDGLLAANKLGRGKYEIVYPSVSILAETPVAVVDKVVDRRKTRAIAEAYVKFLYSPQAQEIAARNYYRPRNAQVASKYKGQFRSMPLLQIDRNFGGWPRTQKTHLDDGGVFDQIFEQAKR